MQYVKKDGKHTTLLGTDFWQNFSVDDPSPADSTQMIPETEARKKNIFYTHTHADDLTTFSLKNQNTADAQIVHNK